jgi:hypothetical protein
MFPGSAVRTGTVFTALPAYLKNAGRIVSMHVFHSYPARISVGTNVISTTKRGHLCAARLSNHLVTRGRKRCDDYLVNLPSDHK